MPGSRIQYLKRKDIDIKKWDNCVAQNSNGLIYAYSFFLDKIAINWNGIIVNDYDCIIPIPWRRKYGINYQFKPAFIQQLGIIGNASLIDSAIIQEKITGKIKYGTLLFNFSNKEIANELHAHSHVNMVLGLSAGYDKLYSGFSSSVKNHIKQSQSKNLHYTESNDIDGAIDLYENLYSKRMLSIKNDDYRNLKILSKLMFEKEMCLIRKVKDSNGTTLATTLLLKDTKRIYNLISSITIEGRHLKANYFLFDELIREFSGQPLLLDFEGSDLEGIKQFYGKFGSHNEPYFYLNYNRLPWPLTLLKK
ncbi:MAG: hypothetical protein ABI415_09405 [Flavitalea sp.]